MGASLSYATVDLSDRVAIITGANSGTGYEAAKALAGMGAKVVLACRSQVKAEEAMARMKREVADRPLDLEFGKLDLASLQSTVEFAEDFKAKHDKLNILCCNAGFMTDVFGLTEDGMEAVFQTNYLGHFLLITRLLPLLKTSSPDPRIVSVASYAGFVLGRMMLTETNDRRAFGNWVTYGTSKLYQMLMTGALHRRLGGVTVSSIHPGSVHTGFAHDTAYLRVLKAAFGALVLRTPAQGAATIIYACVNPELEGRKHLYMCDCAPAQPFANALDVDQQEELFRYSVALLKDYIEEDGAQLLGIDLATVKAPEAGLPAPGGLPE